MFTRTQKLTGAMALLAAGALVLTACSGDAADNGATDEGSNTGASSFGVEANPELFDMLPESIQESGVLKVGTEAYYPPYEYFAEDQETIIGLDPDIDQALADALGIELNLQNMSFDGLLPALDSGRIDVVSAALGATPERLEKYDFISYFNATQGITTTVENPKNIKSREDMCGLNISVLDASAQLDMLDAMNDEVCASNPMKISAFPTDADALQQLTNGRADANLAQYAVAEYSATTYGEGEQFAVVSDESFGPYYLGKVVSKDDAELRDALLAAMNYLIETGAYEKILDSHGLIDGAMPEAELNKIAE